jgi:acetate---CoA ligase (ADP-forming)
MTDAVTAMLRARSIALVGASSRSGSFGARMVDEVGRGSSDRRIHFVNPRYDEIAGHPCLPSLKHLGEPVDLALLAVADDALEAQLRDAADLGVRSAVIFGSAHGTGLRERLRAIAVDADMAVCGAGCMGFINVSDDLRATGYLERVPLPGGPIALVTHSGSIFSALLRTRRALGYTLAVSSGQELVTTAADYLDFALDQPGTRLLALVLETVRDPGRLVAALQRAAAADVPAVILPVGGSELGSALVAAHSGALAGNRGMWEALAEGTGALLVKDLAELTDTLELLAIGRPVRDGSGIATVHDSGAERSLAADLADELGIAFAPLADATLRRLDDLLDDGLTAANPLDLWGRGANTRELFATSLAMMAADPAVSLVALAVDLVEEYDRDTSYIDAALDVDDSVPLVVLTNLASAVDQEAAARLRAAGIPVLEGTSSGLAAIGNLLRFVDRPPQQDLSDRIDPERRDRWVERLQRPEPLDPTESFGLLADYAIPVAEFRQAATEDDAAGAAGLIGYPVVLKTAMSTVAHKTDVDGVVLGIADEAALRAAYRDLAARLGADVTVSAVVGAGVEIALGIVRDRQLGPLVLVGVGGVFTELIADRAMGMPLLSHARAHALLQRLTVRPVLDGWRGGPACDLGALVECIVAVGVLAAELGEHLDALDVNPLVVRADGAVAVDVLVQQRA